MIFLNIYIGFSLLTFVVLLMQTYLSSKKLKRRYPDLVNEFNKKNQINMLEKIFVCVKALISCFVPIVNIGIFYISLFEAEKIEETTLNKMKEFIRGNING